MAEAEYSNTFQLPRSTFDDAPVWAGIDFGCSLLKVVYVTKEEALDKNADPVTLHCASYSKDRFEEMLQVLKAKVHFPADQPLRVTGVGCTRLEGRFQEVLGVKIAFVQEFLAACRGFYLMRTAVGEDAVFYPKPPPSTTENTMPPEAEMMFKMLKQKYVVNNPTDGAPFPAIYFQVGSGSAVCFIDKEGKSRFVSGVPCAGKTFLGLSKLLLGTSNYEQVTTLAAQGSRGNTDLTVRDMIANDPDSAYGRFSSDLAIMPFAKAVDQERGLESFSREDLAAGMVGLISSTLFFFTMSAAELLGVNRVYFGGGFVRSEVIRNELQSVCDGFFKDMVEFRYLRSEHMGAFGTMLTKPEDMMKYMLM